MEIKVCTTLEWTNKIWETYLQSFNTVFKKDFDISHFKEKYLNVLDKSSYHALLLDETKNVVGGLSVMPFKYKNDLKIIRLGQAVDSFIIEKYRVDPLMLRKMYLQLKKLLIIKDIKAVLSVPNETSYPYWKKIVNWKDVGDLNYWILPIRISNIINKWSFLNFLSLLFVHIWLGFNYIIILIANNKEKRSNYELVLDDNFYQNRYTNEYTKITLKDIVFYFRIYNEEGVKTAYLMDVKQNNIFTFKSLYKAVSYISRKTNTDMVLYVGSIKLFQTILIKVPKRYKPKRLPLTCDILNKDEIDQYSNMFELESWNYGLINFDVR